MDGRTASTAALFVAVQVGIAFPAGGSAQGIVDVLVERRDASVRFDWSPWEIRPAGGVRPALEAAALCTEGPGGQDLTPYFHFTEVTGDGVVDLVYDGPPFATDAGVSVLPRGDCARLPGLEGWVVALLEGAIGGFREVEGVGVGTVRRMWRAAPWQAVSLITEVTGCCGELHEEIHHYRPTSDGSSLAYELWDRVRSHACLDPPPSLFDRPRAFLVTRTPYNLRLAPSVAAEGPEGCDEEAPNLLHEYAQGARGVALGEHTDETGRTWWFSRMEDGRAGWLSARYLEPAGTP